VRLTVSLATAEGPVGATVGEATGDGLTAGVGLGTSGVPTDPVMDAEPLLPKMASAVPQPAMSTTSATTPAMISIQGVRWTGAVAPTGV
jgi:hypothetical protein